MIKITAVKGLLFIFILFSSLFSGEYKNYIYELYNHNDVNKAILKFQDKINFLPNAYKIALLDNLFAITHAYYRYIKGFSLNKTRIYYIMHTGERILFDDYQKRTFKQRLSSHTTLDILYYPYTPFVKLSRQEYNHDPGRFRNYKLLNAVYGGSKEEIRGNLVKVSFCGKKVWFNRQNGAAYALKKVSDELERLVRYKPYLKKYLTRIEGTYIHRNIKYTDHLSAHAYGIAIDLNLERPFYWLHNGNGMDPTQEHISAMPGDIVRIFEKHQFIWGGRWFHFDKIHFEYRPEFYYNLK